MSGAQLAIDTTLVSPVTREGQPRRHAGTFRGAALHTARQSKERTYPELLNSRRCKLVVLAIEVGRLWSQEAANFIRFLAKSRARHVPAILQTSVEAALVARWSAMMSHAAMQTFAATLIDEDPSHHKNVEGNIPPLNQILAETPLAPYPPHPAFLFDLEGPPFGSGPIAAPPKSKRPGAWSAETVSATPDRKL